MMLSVWDMVLQRGSTIQVSTEFLVATRLRRDMTKNMLKSALNPNKQEQRHLFNNTHKTRNNEK